MRKAKRLVLLPLVVSGVLLLAGCESEGEETVAAGGGEQASSIPARSVSVGELLGEVNVAEEERAEEERRFREEKVLDDAEALRLLLNEFWSRELYTRYQIEFDPPDFFGYYRGAEGPSCNGVAAHANNAFYCFADWEEQVAFDLDWFEEYLIASPGGATTFLILAHEWGHAVQDTWLESGGPDRWAPPNQELNADCLAGVFLAQSIREGTIIEESGDAEAIFGWLYEVGNSPWLGPGSHGTKEERQTAFVAGIERGTEYCRTVY